MTAFAVIVGVIGAATGIGGLVTAAIALRQNRNLAAQSDSIQERLAAVEEARRNDELEQRRREQAERVSCWLDVVMVDEEDSLASSPKAEPVVRVRNASDLPIHHVSVEESWPRIMRDGRMHETGQAGKPRWFRTVPPQETVTAPWVIDRPADFQPEPVLEFYDTDGNRWRRDQLGYLHALPKT